MKRSQNLRIVLFIWICLIFYFVVTLLIINSQKGGKNRDGEGMLPAKGRISIEEKGGNGEYPDYVTCYTYFKGELTGKYRYRVTEDGTGTLVGWTLWRQEESEHTVREYSGGQQGGEKEVPGERLYEYDDAMRVLHQLTYREEKLREELFYRYEEDRSVCVRYQYGDMITAGREEKTTWGICSYTSSVYDAAGNEVCRCYFDGNEELERVIYRVFDEKGRQIRELSGEDDDNLTDMWTMEWEEETAEGITYLNGTCYDKTEGRDNPHAAYRAEYEGNDLLWEVFLTDDRLAYARAYDYDTDGNVTGEAEYSVYDGSGHSLLLQMRYNEEGQISEVCEYEMTGKIAQACKEKGYVEFFPDGGSDTPMRITRVNGSGEKVEYYEFGEDGILQDYRNFAG